MSLEDAVRLTEIILAAAMLQQSLEHLSGSKSDIGLFLLRAVLCVLLLFGVATDWTCWALLGLSLLVLRRFQGPYNGGSDRMGLLALCVLCLAHLAPSDRWREYAFGYLAVQLALSYVVAGWVKIVNVDWRSGQALRDVFAFSAYPVSETVRGWADRPRLLLAMSWSVMVFELVFPLALLSQATLAVGLIVAAAFHLANACLFGLNRFFWTWLAAYPSIIWLQERLTQDAGF